MLEIHGLHKAFDGIKAVNNFDLDLREGAITALIGPNGAGKTTLFNLITGFLQPEEGRVLWKGADLTPAPPDRIARQRISRTFQEVRIFRDLTVAENLLMAKRKGKFEGLFSSIFSRRAFRRFEADETTEILNYLDTLSLSDQINDSARALSYGQSKLVEILRASLTDPELLLLDEPAGGLNPVMIGVVSGFIRSLVREKGMTVFFIEHNFPFVLEMADWVVVMDHGAKIAEGPPGVIKSDTNVIEAYLG